MQVTGKAVQVKGLGEGLFELKRRFDEWRAGRKVGERIPSELWARAVAASVEHGAYRVSAELHLDYGVLKRRAALADHSPGGELAPRFVELFAPASAIKPAAASQPECVVELANARGAKMRVELSGNGLAGLSSLCSAFWTA